MNNGDSGSLLYKYHEEDIGFGAFAPDFFGAFRRLLYHKVGSKIEKSQIWLGWLSELIFWFVSELEKKIDLSESEYFDLIIC